MRPQFPALRMDSIQKARPADRVGERERLQKHAVDDANIAVLEPIPMASVSTAVVVKSGDRRASASRTEVLKHMYLWCRLWLG